MDYVGLRDGYIEKARKAERDANQRTERIRDNATAALIQRNPKFTQLPFDERQAQARDLMLEWRKNDAVWKGHIADNQWFIQQAIMYGNAATGTLLAQLIHMLKSE